MSPRLLILTLCCAASGPYLPRATAEDLGIQVPEGFEVSLYADDTLAHDIFSMTLDAQGRVVVAGAGYVKTLHDDDGDGRADRASLYSQVPASGAHGMVFDGADLICTGDNSVMRLRDANGDGQADGPGEMWTSLRHTEHGANGLVRGPDGCYFLVCGNDAGVSQKQITTDTSPVKQPRSGAVVRFSPEGKPLDVFAHGFRNPYDLDFDADGHLFTVDSDGERDHHLPWYAPTRLFDIAQGQEHGWLLMGWARGWNRPASFFDNVERLVEIGRGSPTGVTVYRHRAFPEHYRGGVLDAGPRLLFSARTGRRQLPLVAGSVHADHGRCRLCALRSGCRTGGRIVRGDWWTSHAGQRVSRDVQATGEGSADLGRDRSIALGRPAAGQLVARVLGAFGPKAGQAGDRTSPGRRAAGRSAARASC
jgi:hypothetical protein